MESPTLSGRTRRNADSWSESDRGPFAISNRKFRVAAPPARPLPLETRYVDISVPIQHAFGIVLQKEADRALELHGVDLRDEWTHVEIVDRFVLGYPDTQHPTVLITAPWTHQSHQSWPKIVMHLKKFADSLLKDPSWRHVDMAVEMLAVELCAEKYISPVVGNKKLEEDWPQISNRVLSILDSSPLTRHRTTGISLFRLGYNSSVDLNPVTVYVTVDYECFENNWPPALAAIQAELDTWSHDLVVFVEHGEPELFGVQLLSPKKDYKWRRVWDTNSKTEQPYQAKALIGADVAVSTYHARDDGGMCCAPIGTLGCYLEVEWEGEAGWKKLGLTSYHVVRPAFQGFQVKDIEVSGEPDRTRGQLDTMSSASHLSNHDVAGFGPDTESHAMEHPSRSRHNFIVSQGQRNVQNLAKHMSAGSQAPALSELHQTWTEIHSQHLAFFDKGHHHLGKLWGGSGLTACTSDAAGSRRLDWALIEVQASREANNVLLRELWNSLSGDQPFHLHDTSLRQPSEETSLKNLESGHVAYKIGAISGATVGQYNKYRSVTWMNHDGRLPCRPTMEHQFLAPEHGAAPFAEQGDSGAVVFDSKGQVMGIVLSGHTPQQARPGAYALVTPIEDVFRHIRLSGNKVKNVRVACVEGALPG